MTCKICFTVELVSFMWGIHCILYIVCHSIWHMQGKIINWFIFVILILWHTFCAGLQCRMQICFFFQNTHVKCKKTCIIIFYVPVAYIIYLRNPRVYSNSPSILGCFTDSVRFLAFFLRDVIFSGMLYFHNIPLFFLISRSI
jgi:hypothetical protein